MVNENEVITIKLDDIIPNRFQPREMFDEESMQELADSIKTHGVITHMDCLKTNKIPILENDKIKYINDDNFIKIAFEEV